MSFSRGATDGRAKNSPRAPVLILLVLLIAITAMGALANQFGRTDLADPAVMIDR